MIFFYIYVYPKNSCLIITQKFPWDLSIIGQGLCKLTKEPKLNKEKKVNTRSAKLANNFLLIKEINLKFYDARKYDLKFQLDMLLFFYSPFLI